MRKLTTIILLLCALVVGAQGAIVTLGPGGDAAHLEDLVGVLANTDTVYVAQSYADSSAVGVNLSSIDDIVFDLRGYTLTHITVNDTMMVVGEDWKIINGSIASCKSIIHTQGGVLTLSDLDITAGEGPTVTGLIRCSYLGGGMVITDCNFSSDGSASASLAYVYNSIDTPLTVSGSSFDGCGYGIQSGAQISSANAWDISTSTFENCNIAGVQIYTGGEAVIDSCSFTLSTYDASTWAINYRPETTGASNGVISNCTFNDWLTLIGNEGDGAQGDSITVDSCTFTGTNISSILIMRANHGIVQNCTFNGTNGDRNGSPTNGPHIMLVGYDGAYDQRDGDAADSVVVRWNNFFVNKMPTHETPIAYYCLVIKSDNCRVYGNSFQYSGLGTLETPVITPNFIHPKGARNTWVYNNNFTCDNDSISVIYVNRQSAALNTDSLYVYNNKITGTYDDLVKFEITAQDTGMVFSHNYYAGSASADSVLVSVDASESAWWGDANFNGAGMTSTWLNTRLRFGGDVANNITPFGGWFYPIGVQSSESAATAVASPPVIGGKNGAFGSLIEALRFMRIVQPNLSGVELPIRVSPGDDGLVDQINLDMWYNGLHVDGDGTVNATTWSATASDTLRPGPAK